MTCESPVGWRWELGLAFTNREQLLHVVRPSGGVGFVFAARCFRGSPLFYLPWRQAWTVLS